MRVSLSPRFTAWSQGDPGHDWWGRQDRRAPTRFYWVWRFPPAEPKWNGAPKAFPSWGVSVYVCVHICMPTYISSWVYVTCVCVCTLRCLYLLWLGNKAHLGPSCQLEGDIHLWLLVRRWYTTPLTVEVEKLIWGLSSGQSGSLSQWGRSALPPSLMAVSALWSREVFL